MHKKHFIGITVLFFVFIPALTRADETPAQDPELVALANQFSNAFDRHDSASAGGLIDIESFYGRLTAGVSASATFQQGFHSGFFQSFHLADQIVKSSEGGSYRFLRIRKVAGETRVLFRLLSKAGGLNYHDWIVGKDPNGRLKFQDVYVALTGELMSQTMHRAYLQAAIASNPGLLDRLTGKDKEYASNVAKFAQMANDSQSGSPRQVVNDYKALPKSLQEDKTCMILYLTAAFRLKEENPEEYTSAMVGFQKQFPGDPAVELDCMDALYQTKQFDQVRKSLDRLEAYFGTDAYLLLLDGNSYLSEGGDDNNAKAKDLFQQAIDMEPTLAKPYWSLVTVSLNQKDYDQTARTLTLIQTRLHLKIADLTKIPIYAGFVKSDAYQTWLAGQSAPGGL